LCSFFKRKGFYFDAGAHYFGSLGDSKSFGGLLLRALDLDTQFIRMDPVDILQYPDRLLRLPSGLDTHVELLQGSFPGERDSIARFFQELLRIYRHFYRGKRNSELLARYRWASYQDILDQFLADRQLKSILSATVGYIGISPSRVSAIAMAAMVMSYWYDGGYLARGGSQSLPDSLMRRFAQNGGHLLLNTPVERILVADGNKVTGVVLAAGREVRARVVVSNADAKQTFFRLLGPEQVESNYLEHLAFCRESASCFVVYLGIRCDDHMLQDVRGWHWDSYQIDDPANIPLYIATPTLEDKSLCPAGHHILTATTLFDQPRDAVGNTVVDWKEHKRDLECKTMSRLEKIVPGITDRVVVKESATPRTIHRYTQNSTGAMYGWEASPDQFWLNRLPVQTPIQSLYLCGHWTTTGPGVISVVGCGFLSARMALESLSNETFPAHSLAM